MADRKTGVSGTIIRITGTAFGDYKHTTAIAAGQDEDINFALLNELYLICNWVDWFLKRWQFSGEAVKLFSCVEYIVENWFAFNTIAL